MSSESSYTSKLTRLRHAIHLLPASLPSGSAVYDFSNWSPDPDQLDDYGAEGSVLNAHLERVFGLRNGGRITLTERGPGIESIVDIFTQYLTGDYAEKPVIDKWLDDLIDAAEHMSRAALPAKRTSKLSAAQKRSNEWKEEENEEKAQRKRAKVAKAEAVSKRAAEIAKTAQSLNWSFDDLRDIKREKIYTVGRRGYAIVDDLVIDCEKISTGARRFRCSSEGCQQSWASRQPQRVLAHAIQKCNYIDEDLRQRAAEESDGLAPGSKVAKLDSAKASQGTGKPTNAQPSVASLVVSEGRKAKQIRFDIAVLNFVSAAQLPPFKLDLPEFHAMIAETSSTLTPKSSGYIASCQIPMESSRLRRLSVKDLKKYTNLTISYDGGSTIRPQSFTTIHVTTPDTRIPYLMEAPEASGVSHTGQFYFQEVEKVIREIGPHRFSGLSCDSASNALLGARLIHEKYPTILVLPDPCHTIHNAVKDICRLDDFTETRSNMQKVWGHFSRSAYAAAHLAGARTKRGVTRKIEKPGKTRFGGWHYASESVEVNLPCVEDIVQSGAIEVKKDHKLAFMRNVKAYSQFKVEVHQLTQVTRPFARAIKCLESGHSNLGNVFLFNLGLMASLQHISDNNDSELGIPDDVMKKIVSIANNRYSGMVLALGREAYISTFILNPQYRDSDILRRNNLNPLRTGIVVLRSSVILQTPEDAELARLFPCFPRLALFLKKVFCQELAAGLILAAADFSNDEEGVHRLIQAFKSQLAAFLRGEYPFILPSAIPTDFSPLQFWTEKEKHPDANLLAPVAVKLFSVVPNSMAEERTVSCFTKLNSKDRSSQKVSTLVHMTRIRHDLIRKRANKKPVIRPVLKFCDLSGTLLKQTASTVSNSAQPSSLPRSSDLANGWLSEDIDQLAKTDSHDITEHDSDSDSDNEDDSADELPKLEAEISDLETDYGVNFSSQILRDLLSDQVQPKPAFNGASSTQSASQASNANKEARKTLVALTWTLIKLLSLLLLYMVYYS
ncbi:hypothetical protein FRC09_007774 [Ceratobasidium sp. 395]|nr:hypothetical protein FRC09_007774 [Ceratobasidium sp. 395]